MPSWNPMRICRLGRYEQSSVFLPNASLEPLYGSEHPLQNNRTSSRGISKSNYKNRTSWVKPSELWAGITSVKGSRYQRILYSIVPSLYPDSTTRTSIVVLCQNLTVVFTSLRLNIGAKNGSHIGNKLRFFLIFHLLFKFLFNDREKKGDQKVVIVVQRQGAMPGIICPQNAQCYAMTPFFKNPKNTKKTTKNRNKQRTPTIIYIGSESTKSKTCPLIDETISSVVTSPSGNCAFFS